MLTIITGAPGAGKTCALVSLLAELSAARALFVDGVNGLTVPHEPVDARKWHEAVPDGSAIAVDEGQRVWRPRGPGQKVPEDVAALETHRHRGIDFFVTTQHPKLLDANVRNLCGRHVHIRDLGVLGRWWYEWPEAADPGTWRSAPIKKRYRLDRSAFAKYKSASEHIKPIRSFPWMLGVLVLAVIAFIVAAWFSWRAITSHLPSGQPAAKPAASVPVVSGAPAPIATVAAGSPMLRAYLADATQFTPRLSSKPETAPAYDDLRKVVSMPRVVGGWCQGAECRCLNQQGRDSGLSARECRAWLASPPFDPYSSPDALQTYSRGHFTPVQPEQGREVKPSPS